MKHRNLSPATADIITIIVGIVVYFIYCIFRSSGSQYILLATLGLLLIRAYRRKKSEKSPTKAQ